MASLGDLADVGIGYVTGDNDFFHLDETRVESFGLPPEVLKPALRNASGVPGLCFTREDWQDLHDSGQANLLPRLHPGQPLPDSAHAYLRQGIRKGVPDRYKCRVREPWYAVPHVYQGDAFVTYMSGSAPRLIANPAWAVAPNTLLVLRLYPLSPGGLEDSQQTQDNHYHDDRDDETDDAHPMPLLTFLVHS